MIALLRQVASSGNLTDTSNSEGALWARMRVRMVKNNIMDQLGYSSKMNAEWEFLSMLKEAGRKAAEEFLAEHGGDIGKTSTLDIDRLIKGD